MDPELLVTLKALTSPDRLRILGAIATRPRTGDELASDLGLPPRRVMREVGLLRRAGLVEFDRSSSGPAHALAIGRLAAVGRALDALEPVTDSAASGSGPDLAGLPPEDARVLRAFLEGGRLTSIPAQGSKRLVVLRHLRERCFPEDRAYPEKEVNQRLALVHPDVAALRRYLVDTGLMTRSAGEYRRAPEAPTAPGAASGTTPPG